ncbi:mitochondrial inner-membrane-bound regulator-domain-containing protein [Colletotrichum navitas]|uniref:Mitochondrial inner-membrane-bound regulator-domain-containing protein n=1 Tax=Colletotrichum navitas TaxID=681940 RepID=A0AAD8PPA8_9PEZI|nr:mitochondrial inner-membrane-bound regulator-domain-containing protein [Colletotrichum navitas]KAK1573811.1 mitochondrial inner-membrane-bound regulator-domain-containing protein [Colletotrichum navitas]
MLSRASYARSVCLRCQLRLLDRPRANSSLRIPPFQPDFLQRRLYSADSAWDRIEKASDGEKDPSSSTKDTRSDGVSPKDEPPQAHPVASSPSVSSGLNGPPSETEPATQDRPLIRKLFFGRDHRDRREHRRLGKRNVYLQSQELDVSMLGEKARAIVMRETRGNPKVSRELPVEEPLAPEFDLKASLEAEAKDLTMEEALANVDGVRPTEPIVSQSEFDRLLEVLLNGFTVAQLRAYLARENAKARTTPEGEKVLQYDWIQDEKPWAPLLLPEIVGSPKERLVLTLMIEAWRLSIREMVDGIGFYSAKIKERILVLLARDRQRLDAIRDAYLDEGEDIQFTNQRVRITATKAKTETILKKLDESVQLVVTKHVHAPWLSNYDVRSTLLHYLGNLTNTFITFSTKSHNLRISWFNDGAAEENDAGEQLDNVVQRLLYTALQPEDASVSLQYELRDDNGKLIPESSGLEKLSWKDRLTQWSRYVAPVGRVSPAESGFPLEASDVFSHPIQRLVQDSDATWSKRYTSTVASFGKLLHRKQDGFNLAVAAKAKNHVFSPTSPHPTSLNALDEALTTIPTQPMQTTLVLGFRRHPSLYAVKGLPHLLKLRLVVPWELPEGPLSWDACEKDLVAVLDQTFNDVAYPSEPVDMRLSQSWLSVMSPAALDGSPFCEYTKNAKLDLAAGRLRPPPEIELSGLPSTEGDGIFGGAATYVFSGLEIRRSLGVRYQDHKVHYTSVEAGLHGGRRSELVFEALPTDDDAPDEVVKAYTNRYLALAHDLVTGKVVKWVGERDIAREFENVDTGDVDPAAAEKE